jgi:hypothetical protein
MTKEQLDNNKIIARFVGKEHDKRPSYYYFGEINAEGNQHWKLDTDMEFHISWDWLMPVISKITKDEKYIGNEYRESILDTVPYGNIEDSYKVVLEFIKWYNNERTTNNI